MSGSVLGTGPIEYLTQWRMGEATRLLADPRTSVAAVAGKLGYRTEAAFRRAFKPAHLREHLRLGAIPPLRRGVRLDP